MSQEEVNAPLESTRLGGFIFKNQIAKLSKVKIDYSKNAFLP